MPRFFLDISMSLDGFVAGPDATLEEPLGKGGERLHDWVLAARKLALAARPRRRRDGA